ncbi:MAG: AraC family transcriptional regulator [Saprospiraceae bacterium]|nr:AraC family transcriptional regulator [Saprospiraceae bacterium]
MISYLYRPKYPLSDFIESIYYYKDFIPAHAIDRLLPDGNVQLIIDLTEQPKYIYDNRTLKEIQACKRVWFSGFRTEPITIPSGQDSEMIIVQFMKGRAYPFMSDPMDQVKNLVVDAELVLKFDIHDLRQLLQDVDSVALKIEILEEELLKHYLPFLERNPFTDFVISKIIDRPHHCCLSDISDQVGYSQKHVIKIFKANVGVTPKEFLKIIRFQKAIQDIEERRVVSWTSISDDCGFYDQSHFIADFRNFSGMTPSEYLKQRGPYLNYIPVLDI